MQSSKIELGRPEAIYTILAYVAYMNAEARTGRSPIAALGEISGEPKSSIPLGVIPSKDASTAMMVFGYMKSSEKIAARYADLLIKIYKRKPSKMSINKFLNISGLCSSSTYYLALDWYVRTLNFLECKVLGCKAVNDDTYN